MPYTLTSSADTDAARWGDNAGASVDPFDDTSIWLAHHYPVPFDPGTNYGLALWVSKVFGSKEPDLVVPRPLPVLCCAVVQPGEPISIDPLFYNQGDGAAPASLANVLLSKTQSVSLNDTLIGQMAVGALPSGETLQVTHAFTIPLSLSPGLYYVGVIANAGNTFVEFSTTNNSGASAASVLIAHPGPWLPLISR